MKKKTNNKVYQIHVRVSEDSYKHWIEICAQLNGNTQSTVFRNLINKIYSSITEINDIKHYEEAKGN